ncbi:MAG: amphi-Trp domain-containing protein [Saprospirales bacterium]|nr:MAG: amphi-Trp domain-containing protein [Saprospirales bacterium]
MGKEVRLFKTQERKTRAEVADFLRLLADKLSDGEVLLKSGSEEISLNISPSVTLEIQVEDEDKKKGIQHSLEVEIKWYDGKEGVAASGIELG